MDNLVEVIAGVNTDKQRQQRMRQAKVKVERRTRQFYLFVDLKKAFDRVNRRKLLEKMQQLVDNATVASSY